VRKQQEEELRRINDRRRLEQETPVPCINTNCKELGTPAMSYLCKECYDKQRKEAMDMENKPEKSEVDGPASTKLIQTDCEVGRDRIGPELHRQNTLVNLGSSKFYTFSEEDQSLPPSKYDMSNNVLQPQPNLNNSSAIGRDKVRKAPLELSRSSFYDESLTSQSRPLAKTGSPGTARIINNLKDEDFTSGMIDSGNRDSSQYSTSYHNERPKPIVETRQNIINLNTVDHQNMSNYGPKVQNVAQIRLQDPQQYSSNNTVIRSSNTMPQYVVNSSNISGKFVSRIDVGNSPTAEYPPRQKCRNHSCQSVGLEDKEYYCGKCYEQYDRNRTTFL
jgi:hypothetical protein